ncbi:transcriptional regulator [Sphaerochaeta pleomorpha str. Grapes]|uniref:Transcriptional regulator n=1 Tax=Sphaerochaeta pleomorpha (strain ATCC BAA-1885 / DSM 22778 / Grapes) TaxID=158190 RepID=G8QXT1_SPHPG|nr:TetR/AcrR family transcriptional regulator [Sphaerochaeta pleomorpha]AEV30725.1 transcriptional regulator [Sphaerochaeta pleomorpha str. Grapes]
MHTTDMKNQLTLSLLHLGSLKGLDNVSLSDLAKENKISKASIFHHFSNREELISHLFAFCSNLAYTQQATISLAGTAEEVLLRAVDHWHEVYTKEPLNWFYRIVESEKLTHREAGVISKTLGEMVDGQSRILLETLSDSLRLDIEELDLAVMTFSATVQNFLSKAMVGNDPDILWQEERFITKFCKLYAIQ